MSDSSEEQGPSRDRGRASGGSAPSSDAGASADEESLEELRRQVEEKYDLDAFTPDQMAEMSVEEWEAVFDPDTWITGPELLDRVERDLANRIANRDVFARVERFEDPGRLVAYSDEGYAVVYDDGTVKGTGTVLRDVETSVALCSMEEYDVPPMPEGDLLPRPEEVAEGSGDLGHRLMQVVAVIQLLAGIGLVLWAGYTALTGSTGSRFGNPASPILGVVVGLGFLFVSVVFFLVVANARLSDRFRAEEYRERLRALGIGSDEPPEHLLAALDDHPELASAYDADLAGTDDSSDSASDPT